jgi:hypothetical protein
MRETIPRAGRFTANLVGGGSKEINKGKRVCRMGHGFLLFWLPLYGKKGKKLFQKVKFWNSLNHITFFNK